MTLIFKAQHGVTEGLQGDIEAALADALADGKSVLPAGDALAIEVVFFTARPESAPPSQRWPVGKPTPWEVGAAVRRALHRVVFTHATHVVSIKTDKRYCVNGQEPHTRVEVWTAGAKRYSELRPRREVG